MLRKPESILNYQEKLFWGGAGRTEEGTNWLARLTEMENHTAMCHHKKKKKNKKIKGLRKEKG